MKKFTSALAVAAVLGAPAIASAQTDIRPYLTADVGVSYITNYSDQAGVENDYQYNDSNVASSVYGLRASHDLGNGMRLIGNLEGDFNTGTGDHNAAGMFRRAANVGIQGAFGQIELGTKMNPLVAFHGASGYALGGNSVSTNVAASMGFANFFTERSITYSAKVEGLTAQIQYGFENRDQAPPNTPTFGTTREAMYSGFVRYDIAGLAVGASAQHIVNDMRLATPTNPSGDDVTTWIVGAGYTFAGWTARAFWVNNEDVHSYAASDKNTAWHLGLKYALNPQLEVGGSYTMHNTDSWLANLQARYAMSKHLVLYGLINHVDNDEDGATFGLLWNNGNDLGTQRAHVAGESETALAVGMIVSF